MDDSHRNGEVTKVSETLERSLTIDSDDRMEKYQRLIQNGKDVARRGDMDKALEFFKLANNIHQSQKLEIRIKKIEELIAQNDSEEEDDEFVSVNNSGLMLFKELHDKLYDYQRDGVAFLYSLYRDGRKGGILADDMGLGKTIQVISFLSGMYDNELAKHTLLVMPTSLITNWTKEFAKWTPGMRVKEFHGISKGERTRNLEKVQRRSGVLITTYTMLMNNWEQVSSYHGREFTWDYMILDEAHKIKNTGTKTAKSVYAIRSKNRVLLTGTPVQNNLREMWALFDFACQGALLGTAKTFKAEYENPITRAREKDATPGEKALGMRMSETLMTTIKPYFLRRTKSEVQKNRKNGINSCKEKHLDNNVPNVQKVCGAMMPELTRKNDLIVWTYLSSVQEDIYRQFISLDHIKELLLTTRSPLAELNMMKKLCDHPRLLSAAAISKLGLEENGGESQQGDEADTDAHSIDNIPDDTLISESGKLVFLFALLERLREEGHRTLVFAHYRKVLDIIERILGNRGFKVLRLDGTITQIAERERRISLFQTDDRYSVFLLTTQVGGVGITLTAANRVVIYDPSWNPATDAQAVDRAYRIGQTENVIVYRLITCGTVEEKIYRRQVFKDSLIRQNTGDKKNPFRYFSKQELKELFTLEDTRSSSTQLQLQELHSRHRRTDLELDEHIAHLHTMEMFGISDHDLMFSLDVHNDEAPENQVEHQYIEGRVQKAQELMKAESELQMQLAENMMSSTEPAWLRQPADSRGSRERKPRSPKQSPACPPQDHKLNGSVVVVDLDQDSQQNLSDRVIDLTADQSAAEVLEVSQDEVQPPVKEESSYLEAPEEVMESDEDPEAEDPEASVGELMETSEMSKAAGDGSLLEAEQDEQQPNGASPSKSSSDMDLGHHHISPLQNQRLSVLQASNSSFRGDASSRVSTGLESLNRNFQLQLDDSDVSSDDPDTEAEERRLLSQLQMEGSFDVSKSLSERQQREASRQNVSLLATVDESADDSIVATRKKRVAVIYDSEEEEEDEEQQLMKSRLESSFQALGASTPKSGSTPRRTRRSVGGNTSVASRRSLLQSIMEDMNNQEEEEDEGHDDERCDEAEENNAVGSSGDELQMEETEGETLNSEEEDEGDEEDDEEEDQSEEMSLNLEESSGDPELSSSERMDRCAAETDGMEDVCEAESYESLVSRGKECFSRAQLDQALGFFLRAIDIQPGDPEVQLMTIQLYRQLSQRR
ncbi:DNA excision repair protein ERCC-6-like isoform X1 [Amphiprion ocellaris]|nr:DNA excision repair protein ERCC-6-like isoform X1 [Amphiprion ocellaris]